MYLGRKVGNALKWPSLHLVSEGEECIDCKKCTRVCPMSLEVDAMVKVGDLENSECILCGMCVDNCPEDVISFAFRSGVRAGSRAKETGGSLSAQNSVRLPKNNKRDKAFQTP